MKKKIIRPEGSAKKIILLRFCPKKIILPGPKTQAPPPPPWISNGPCLSHGILINWLSNCEGKLSKYTTFKTNFGFKNYLNILPYFEDWRRLSKFRLSAQKLLIETAVGCTASYFVKNYMMFLLVFVTPPPPIFSWILLILRSAEGWLLLDIGWFILFLEYVKVNLEMKVCVITVCWAR